MALNFLYTGVWAGEVWADDPQCSSLAATCEEYVQNTPEAFVDAYWTINALKVYTNGDGSSSSGSTTGSTGSTGNTDNTGSTDEEPSSQAAVEGVSNDQSNAPPTTAVRLVEVPTTAFPQQADPIQTGRPVGGRLRGGGDWGGGRRGGRGTVRKEKRKLRVGGRHLKHLKIESSDRDDGRGQSVIVDSAVPGLGEQGRG
ncbi:MAG: hypothetical protein Q9178_002513 [Gyalolechia marmorata]